MKRYICLFIIACSLCSILVGCGDSYVKSNSEGGLSISMPEYSKPNDEREGGLTDEEKRFVGVWRLVSVEQPNIDSYYEKSYYVFYDTGAYYLIIGKDHSEGEFFAKDGLLFIENKRVKYVINDDVLEIETNNGLTHRLKQVSKETPDRLSITEDTMDLLLGN